MSPTASCPINHRGGYGPTVHQHHSNALDRCGPSRPSPATRARRWRSRRWSTRSGIASCASIPQDPIWPNRDRFVLSNGHASMLLWSVLHLTRTQAVNADYEILGHPSVSLDDIRRFRQLDSKAPGHPEYHWVSGVETTTGPLGQGVATSVGMGIAEKWLANHYNRPGFEIFNYNIYAVCGDGCMMEGIASEAASLAGHLGLDNLCWIYDNNHITIEGNTSITFTEDVAARFLGYGWNVLRVGDANDIERIEHALDIFHKTKEPTHFHRSGQSHRLRLPAQAGHFRRPRRAPRR